MTDVSSIPFDQLVQEYEPTLRRYARWQIPHYDQDDLMQELRLVLWKTQRRFTPGLMQPGQKQPSSFRTYLLRAVRNRMGRLQHAMSWTQSRGAVPLKDKDGGPVYSEKGDRLLEYRPTLSMDAEEVDAIDDYASLEEVEILASLTGSAKLIAEAVFFGAQWDSLGLSPREIEKARKEIRQAVSTSN